ncbi:hypothetical protein LRAMOSA08599 [Lichtheimia ramosa]|uniref:Uncharacterized protein n=1 Tax=Lichtheimia ramosa TaxID=688394 RepID=A0A077WEK6_9FUNG|nr:hypothetical protein LRAMOSA08599 [Lichtheimia ramosa]
MLITSYLGQCRIPRSFQDISKFKDTLNFLFEWKNFLEEIAKEVNARFADDGDIKLLGIFRTPSTPRHTTPDVPATAMTPSRSSRKRHLDEIDL